MAASSSSVPVCLDDLEPLAKEKLDRNSYEYYRSGADREQTLRDNIRAFYRIRLLPRFLQDVSVRRLDTRLLGQAVSFPVGLSPTAMHRMAHPDGEEATAAACRSHGNLMILSTLSTTPMEKVSERCAPSPRWFQLYIYKDRQMTLDLVRRAEASGFSAIVLTVDTPFFGNRRADVRHRFKLPSHLRLANFEAGGEKSDGVRKSQKGSGLGEYSTSLFDPSLTWADVRWLKQATKLPIVLKGILAKEDARLGVEHGASAIMVSNHGARQLDGVPSTIEVLPEIVQEVRGEAEVYLDGGVRTGTDVFKALALGAKAVFIGRPVLWGLAYDGENGVSRVLEILKNELDTAMALTGCATLDDIKPSLVRLCRRAASKL